MNTFIVVISSELYGDCFALGRLLDSNGFIAEMSYQPPIGTIVAVHFQHARELGMDEIAARSEVTHHASAGNVRLCALRFVEFIDRSESIAPEALH